MMATNTTTFSDSYLTVVGETRTEITIKRSVFIGCCLHVQNKPAALDYVDQLRAEFHDAVHHCFAYRIGATGMEFRAVDDGEPSGSAGKPILFAMQKATVSDAIVVVVRYFGGIKLGVGGLARAYAEAATTVLTTAPRAVVTPTTSMTVFCTYDDIARVTGLLEELGLTVKPTYADAVTFDVEVPHSLVDRLRHEVLERTNGRGGTSVAV
jgi:uncharacterized YigZ family protein